MKDLIITIISSVWIGWMLHQIYDEWKEDRQFWKEYYEWERKRKGTKVA